MKILKEKIILVFIFLLAASFRLSLIFRVPFFSSDEAYFNLRHSEHIVNEFLPLVYDQLSYGGNVIVNAHVLHYFLALWDLLFPQWVAYKIVPALLASSVVFIVYILAKKVSKNEKAAMVAALLAAFIPIFVSKTINQIAVESLSIPLFLLLLYSLLEIRRRKVLFLALSFILILLEPLNLLMFFTFLTFVILMIADSIEMRRDEKEAIGLHLILFILVNLILFKNLYLEQGLAAVWQNFPLELYGELFQDFDLFETIAVIGTVPLLLGFFGTLFAPKRQRTVILLGSVLMADFSLLLLKLIPFEQGVLILAVVFCVMSAICIERVIDYLQLTKISNFIPIIFVVFVILTISTLAFSSTSYALDIVDEEVSKDEVEALSWIKDNTDTDSVVLGNVYEGNMIAYIAARINVIDTQFINAEDRLFDVETIFTTESLVKASLALNKYNVDYVYISSDSQKLYGVEDLVYTKDESCFELVFENEGAKVYKVLC